ncbi:hypothetical protein CVT26_002547 [Gymnopilus dilepis]|uniref:CxC2-like cysteine cluster KDZ transposase-associated domain-containing protein n=1 Tax=Gymnopilus dilepis TaxID=231916 RepID=A0A409Y3K2_9AGAR|nr:hypothetical protein CVT26_002547 [Gymnopilus dilepis]
MYAPRLISGRPSKRTRISTTRIPVVPQSSTSDNNASLQTHRTMYREEGLQPSTGRTYRLQPNLVTPDSYLPVDDSEFGLDPDGLLNEAACGADFADVERKKTTDLQSTDAKKKKKSRRKRLAETDALYQSRPMVYWKKAYRGIYLDELLRWEGRGDTYTDGANLCYNCVALRSDHPGQGRYRCDECFVPHLLCKACCLKRHRLLPFHRIEEWRSNSFVRTTLKALGLRVQLNHLGNACSKPEACHAGFTVIHTNGIHEIDVDFCGCRPVSKLRQLLRRGLFPSSQAQPRTCATFSLLKHLHMLSFTSKCSTYDYYRALEKLTNNTGVQLPKSKYRPLLRMMLQWRHLKMLKRGGRAHDATGPEGTKEGELALLCPSCPHPGINLPDGWRDVPEEERFLYFVVLCIDANFRLKNQLVSNYSVDPGLGIGLSYMVSREPFEEYVRSRDGDVDMADGEKEGCGLQAVEQANTKYSKGLRYTGVSSVSCGRSEMILPCSVGNLSRGEKYALKYLAHQFSSLTFNIRYCVMDFSVASALRFVCTVLYLILSYDIACQWFLNFFNRVGNYWPDHLKPPASLQFIALIPKLHEKGHKQKRNHEQFSFNFCKGAGHTDGECPERIWSAHNTLGNATKTMGPGSRQDVLDDHFGFWNHEKYIGMGKTLMRRYKKAIPERNKQTEAHRGFTASLQPQDVQAWEKMCEEWDAAVFPRQMESPYAIEAANITMQQAKKELAEEEKQRLVKGGVVLHETSPALFLENGLEIEDSQRRLSWIVRHKEKDADAISEERQALRKQIDTWRKIQPIYMPGLAQHLRNQERIKPGSTLDGDKPEEFVLWLPSSLQSPDRQVACVEGLPAIEDRLRTAQCHDALRGICDTLRLKSRMVHFKNKNVRGQREGTRSRELINRVHNRARKLAAQYRAARAAKLRLSGPGEWENSLQVLRDSDVRSPQDPERIKPRKRRRGTYEDSELPPGVDAEEGDDNGDGIDLLPEVRSKRDGSGQTRLTISWIWTVIPNDSSSDHKVDKILRAEWCRSRARVNRATEEVQLLREEMRRVLAFLEWRANWWRGRSAARSDVSADLAEGLRAYCASQADHQLTLKASFQTIWRAPLLDHDSTDSDDDSDEDEDSDGDGEGDDGGRGGGDIDGGDKDNRNIDDCGRTRDSEQDNTDDSSNTGSGEVSGEDEISSSSVSEESDDDDMSSNFSGEDKGGVTDDVEEDWGGDIGDSE